MWYDWTPAVGLVYYVLGGSGGKGKVEGSSGTVPWNSSGPVDKGQAAPETGQALPATVNGQGP